MPNKAEPGVEPKKVAELVICAMLRIKLAVLTYIDAADANQLQK